MIFGDSPTSAGWILIWTFFIIISNLINLLSHWNSYQLNIFYYSLMFPHLWGSIISWNSGETILTASYWKLLPKLLSRTYVVFIALLMTMSMNSSSELLKTLTSLLLGFLSRIQWGNPHLLLVVSHNSNPLDPFVTSHSELHDVTVDGPLGRTDHELIGLLDNSKIFTSFPWNTYYLFLLLRPIWNMFWRSQC